MCAAIIFAYPTAAQREARQKLVGLNEVGRKGGKRAGYHLPLLTTKRHRKVIQMEKVYRVSLKKPSQIG